MACFALQNIICFKSSKHLNWMQLALIRRFLLHSSINFLWFSSYFPFINAYLKNLPMTFINLPWHLLCWCFFFFNLVLLLVLYSAHVLVSNPLFGRDCWWLLEVITLFFAISQPYTTNKAPQLQQRLLARSNNKCWKVDWQFMCLSTLCYLF